MAGLFSSLAATDRYYLQLRSGSTQHELIRPSKYRRRCTIRCCSTAKGKARGDYYQVLGVAIHSTPQEIKEAYRKLQKQHHPDIAGDKVRSSASALIHSSFLGSVFLLVS
jgi:DnaJ-domain-containing protein 1